GALRDVSYGHGDELLGSRGQRAFGEDALAELAPGCEGLGRQLLAHGHERLVRFGKKAFSHGQVLLACPALRRGARPWTAVKGIVDCCTSLGPRSFEGPRPYTGHHPRACRSASDLRARPSMTWVAPDTRQLRDHRITAALAECDDVRREPPPTHLAPTDQLVTGALRPSRDLERGEAITARH